jgi:hypothetical protein
LPRLALLVGSVVVVAPVPAPAQAAALPAVVTGGTAVVSMVDNCGGIDSPPNMGKWVDLMMLDLVVRVGGRQRQLSLSTSLEYAPALYDFYPGERGMPCSSSILPTMAFTGSSKVGPSMVPENVTGRCQDSDNALDYTCTLSFDGRSPVIVKMLLEETYANCNSGGGPSEYCDRYDVAVGAQI